VRRVKECHPSADADGNGLVPPPNEVAPVLLRDSWRGRWLALILITTLAGPAARGADGEGTACIDPGQLRKLSECELEHLFAQAAAGPLPVGFGRGQVLLRVNTRLPRLKAGMSNALWKGKVFRDDGSFTNQWVGVQAIESTAGYGVSWYDGKPCIVMEYPLDAPIFGKNRDELRQIGPNLYLCRFYERCPCPKFLGFFVLQFPTCGCPSH
jgi:hypothetical protein